MCDLISRKELLDRIAAYEDETGDELGCVYNIVEKMPTAEPEQKTGRWIYEQDKRFVSCSECGMRTTRNELKGIALFGKDEPKFCPNCGAKMEEQVRK